MCLISPQLCCWVALSRRKTSDLSCLFQKINFFMDLIASASLGMLSNILVFSTLPQSLIFSSLFGQRIQRYDHTNQISWKGHDQKTIVFYEKGYCQ